MAENRHLDFPIKPLRAPFASMGIGQGTRLRKKKSLCATGVNDTRRAEGRAPASHETCLTWWPVSR